MVEAGVHVGKSLRGSTQQKNFLKGITTSTNFTHHQVCAATFAKDPELRSVYLLRRGRNAQ